MKRDLNQKQGVGATAFDVGIVPGPRSPAHLPISVVDGAKDKSLKPNVVTKKDYFFSFISLFQLLYIYIPCYRLTSIMELVGSWWCYRGPWMFPDGTSQAPNPM